MDPTWHTSNFTLQSNSGETLVKIKELFNGSHGGLESAGVAETVVWLAGSQSRACVLEREHLFSLYKRWARGWQGSAAFKWCEGDSPEAKERSPGPHREWCTEGVRGQAEVSAWCPRALRPAQLASVPRSQHELAVTPPTCPCFCGLHSCEQPRSGPRSASLPRFLQGLRPQSLVLTPVSLLLPPTSLPFPGSWAQM